MRRGSQPLGALHQRLDEGLEMFGLAGAATICRSARSNFRAGQFQHVGGLDIGKVRNIVSSSGRLTNLAKRVCIR